MHAAGGREAGRATAAMIVVGDGRTARRDHRWGLRRPVCGPCAAARPGARHPRRSPQPSRVPAAPLSGRQRGALARGHRVPDPVDPATSAQRRGAAGGGAVDRHLSQPAAAVGRHARVRLPDRRARVHARVFRPRRVAAHRTGAEDARGCAGDSAPRPDGLRAGRARAGPREAAIAADVRRRRRRPDRRGAGRSARRDRAPLARARLPAFRPELVAHPAPRSGALGPRDVPRVAARSGAEGPGTARRRGPDGSAR